MAPRTQAYPHRVGLAERVDEVDWGRVARWLAAAAIIGFAALGVGAMVEGDVPCEGQGAVRHGSAACSPFEGPPDTEGWEVDPRAGTGW